MTEEEKPMVGYDRYDEIIRRSLWRLYIEACTRISLRELPDDVGDEGEALDSLYKVFTIARECLVDCYHLRPDFVVDEPKEDMVGDTYQRSACGLIMTLMELIRPFIAKWHTIHLKGLLIDDAKDEFRRELRKLQTGRGSKMGIKQILNLVIAFGRFPDLIDYKEKK